MSQKEAGVRALVAKQPEFVGKITFVEDELATKKLNLDSRVVGISSLTNVSETDLLLLFGFRVAAVMRDEEKRVLFEEKEVELVTNIGATKSAVGEQAIHISRTSLQATQTQEEMNETEVGEIAKLVAFIDNRARRVSEKADWKARIEEERAKRTRALALQRAQIQEEKNAIKARNRAERIARREEKWLARQALIEQERAEKQARNKFRKKRPLSEYFAEIIVIDRTI
jgi:hypothetical protein